MHSFCCVSFLIFPHQNHDFFPPRKFSQVSSFVNVKLSHLSAAVAFGMSRNSRSMRTLLGPCQPRESIFSRISSIHLEFLIPRIFLWRFSNKNLTWKRHRILKFRFHTFSFFLSFRYFKFWLLRHVLPHSIDFQWRFDSKQFSYIDDIHHVKLVKSSSSKVSWIYRPRIFSKLRFHCFSSHKKISWTGYFSSFIPFYLTFFMWHRLKRGTRTGDHGEGNEFFLRMSFPMFNWIISSSVVSAHFHILQTFSTLSLLSLARSLIQPSIIPFLFTLNVSTRHQIMTPTQQPQGSTMIAVYKK